MVIDLDIQDLDFNIFFINLLAYLKLKFYISIKIEI